VKILRFNDDRIGILRDENTVVDVSQAISSRKAKGPQRVIEDIIEHFRRYRRKFERIAAQENGVPLDDVKLLAPIPRPGKCLAAFVNYLDRPDRSVDTIPNEYFYKAPELVRPEGTVALLDIPPVVAYQPEAQLAFVMGKQAKNVKKEKAMDYVFGYVPFFDISARGITRRTQFVPKGQDTHGPCGPWITTKDEIPDPHNLAVKSWVNGQPRQDYNTKHMAHKIPDQIAWLTRFVQLQPGDVIATGTYHLGLGPINDGDILEIEIEKMGRGNNHRLWQQAKE
jgi:2-keto-4-pentenoate hydratase/2-oxohepta-3-ene-1,7-dioic acid hydratase in catechol pathway